MLRNSKLVVLAFIFFNFISFANSQGISSIYNLGTTISIPNFTANGGLPKWQACRAKVLAGTGNCTILWIGDSVSTGHGSLFNVTANDAHSGAIPNELAAILRQDAGLNVQTNSVTGNNLVSPTSTFDTRITLHGWSPFTGAFVIGGNAWANNDTTAFTFKPTDTASYPSTAPLLTNTIDIYWVGNSSGTSITIDIGGSAICTIPVTTTPFNKTTCTTGSAAANNTYNIKCVSASAGNCAFTSIVARNSAVSEVSIINGSADGATIVQFNTNTSQPYDPVASISLFAPDICVMGSTVGNDATAQTPIATYSADLTNIVAACKVTGDVLMLTGFPYGTTTSPLTIAQYQAAIIAVAAANSVPVWDSYKNYGNSSGAGTTGWTQNMGAAWNAVDNGGAADAGHWSVSSNMNAANKIEQILLQ